MHIAQKAWGIIWRAFLAGPIKHFLLKGNIRASAELAWDFGEADKAVQEQVSGAGGQQQLGSCPKTVSNPFLATGGSG